jgi:hypothetical protein
VRPLIFNAGTAPGESPELNVRETRGEGPARPAPFGARRVPDARRRAAGSVSKEVFPPRDRAKPGTIATAKRAPFVRVRRTLLEVAHVRSMRKLPSKFASSRTLSANS